MELRLSIRNESQSLAQLFSDVFAESEGEAEGVRIGGLVHALLEDTDPAEVTGFVAVDAGQPVGAVIFSRLNFEQPIDAWLLAPVAVHCDRQRQGIGQALIRFGLREMRDRGASVAITYGDPKYYGKVGFHPISPEVIRAPFELTQPEGWLGQSLCGDAIRTLSGSCTCVAALMDPVYW